MQDVDVDDDEQRFQDATKYSGSVRVHAVWDPLLRDVNDIPCGLRVTGRFCSRYGTTMNAGEVSGEPGFMT